MKRKILVAVLAGIITLAVLLVWRKFLPQLALVSGIAVGAFVYTLQSTVERLRDLYRHR